jgi:hypothetical protein
MIVKARKQSNSLMVTLPKSLGFLPTQQFEPIKVK